MTKAKIAPSLMCSDFIALGPQLDVMRAAGVEYLHIDIMDGRYVPNFTLGPDFCKKLCGYSPIPLDIHLMIEDPDAHVQKFASFPDAVVSFHPEIIEAFVDGALAGCGVPAPGCGQVELVPVGTVAEDVRGKDAALPLPGLHDRGTGAVSEEDAGIAVRPVDDTRQDLGSYDKGLLCGAGANVGRGDG